MNIGIISYSHTGNNEALADSVAKELSAEHIRISERKARTMATIVLDILLNRTPQVQPAPELLEKYDFIIFFAPVWMGQAATPLRRYFNYLNTCPRKYAFISISGGADGSNPKVAGELEKRTGAAPAALLDLHIANLLSSDPKPDRKATSAYRLNSGDITKWTNTVVTSLREYSEQP